MTNEELWLTSQLARLLGVSKIDIVSRIGRGDKILLSPDRNPNNNGARLLGITTEPGANLPAIVNAVNSGTVRALITLGENPLKIGISGEILSKLPAFVIMDILANAATEHASVVLPGLGFAEKRGSMINGEGRLQRLNRAVRGPGETRDDWEILRDLIQALGGSNSLYTIEDVFREMAKANSRFGDLSLGKIGDLGVQILKSHEVPPPPEDPEAKDIEIAEAKRPPGR